MTKSGDVCPKCGRKNALVVWEHGRTGAMERTTYCRYKGCDYETREPMAPK